MFKVIPEKVLYDKDLPDKAKLIMAEIVSFSINSKDCFISNDTWAERHGVSIRQISHLISVLVEKEYVIRKIIYKANTKRILRRVLIAHPNIIYSLREVSIQLQKTLDKEIAKYENNEVEEEVKEYKKTNLMRDFHKLWENK